MRFAEFSHCKFIKDAYVAVDQLTLTKHSCAKLMTNKNLVGKEIVELNPEKIDEHLHNYDQLLDKQSTLEGETKHGALTIEKNDIAYKSLNKEIENLYEKQHTYHKNKNIIEGKEMLVRQSLSIEKDIKNKKEAFNNAKIKSLNCIKNTAL